MTIRIVWFTNGLYNSFQHLGTTFAEIYDLLLWVNMQSFPDKHEWDIPLLSIATN